MLRATPRYSIGMSAALWYQYFYLQEQYHQEYYVRVIWCVEYNLQTYTICEWVVRAVQSKQPVQKRMIHLFDPIFFLLVVVMLCAFSVSPSGDIWPAAWQYFWVQRASCLSGLCLLWACEPTDVADVYRHVDTRGCLFGMWLEEKTSGFERRWGVLVFTKDSLFFFNWSVGIQNAAPQYSWI